jgi:vitamin B12 transporter
MNHQSAFFILAFTGLLFYVHAADRDSAQHSAEPNDRRDAISVVDSATLSPIVITAARRELRSRWVSDDHTVIDINQSYASEGQSAVELLAARVPSFMSDYGGGGAKKISLRGAGSERTLVLVDGKRTGTSDNDLSDIPSSIIQKIEVVEGGQSALYGMDAIGGVVNIITKRPMVEGVSGSYSSMVGSYESFGNRDVGLNSMTHQATVGMKKGAYEGIVSGDWRVSDGRYEFRSAENALAPRDSNTSRDLNLFARLGRTFDRVSLDVTGTVTDRRVQNPGTISWPSPGTTRKRLNGAGVDAVWHASDISVLRMNSVFGDETIRYVNTDAWSPQNSRHERLYGDIDLVQELTLGRQLLTAGLTARSQRLESNEVGNRAANELSAFAGGVGTFSRSLVTVKTTPSVRFDYSDVYGFTENGKAGAIAGFAIAGEPAVFANIGTASRSPTFNDLYWPQDAWSVGNSDLRPEQSVNADAGAQAFYSADKLIVNGRVTGYFMGLRDMIIWQPDPDDPDGMRWKPDNVAKARIRGIHGSAEMSYANRYTTTLGVTWNDARDDNTDKVLIYRPEYMLTYGTGLSIGPVFTGITCRYMSEVFTDAENAGRLPESTVFDVTAGVRLPLPAGFRTHFGVEYDLYNLTNELRCTNDGYPLPSREHRLSVKVNF